MSGPKCPDCGNEDLNEMSQAASGKKVYCLKCHFSFVDNTDKVYRQRPKPQVLYNRVDRYKALLNRIDQLERRLASLEGRTMVKYPNAGAC
jgi:Zn ribbon nucleic-acid-binding protein